MQFGMIRKNKRKTPQNEARMSTTKRGSAKSSFLGLYNSAKNWLKRCSKRTNPSQFFLFSCGCKVIQRLKQKQEGKIEFLHFFLFPSELELFSKSNYKIVLLNPKKSSFYSKISLYFHTKVLRRVKTILSPQGRVLPASL